MVDEDDSALVARARLGDESAFTTLVRRHLRAAIAVGIAVLHNPTEAEDLAQEAFVIAWQSLDTSREPGRFAGWVLSIVRNRGLNRLQAQRVRAERDVVEEEPMTYGDAERVALKQELLAALQHLTQVQREVVLLHDLESWSHAEISAALNMSEVSSRQHLFQARRVLRGLMAEVPNE